MYINYLIILRENTFFIRGGGSGILRIFLQKKVVALLLPGTDLCVTLHKDAHKNI